jgi:hypothetical protein
VLREGLNLFAKSLIFFGAVLLLLGAFLLLFERVPFLGKLPGDIIIKRKGFLFYFPLLTCLLLSAIITLLLNILRR